MFGKSKAPPLKSLIAAGTLIRGEVCFEDGLRIDGTIDGDVQGCEGKPTVLVIGEGARVNGRVCAEHVIINGEVNGPVAAQRLVELQPKAVVNGDVTYKAIELHLGAKVTGRLCPMPDHPLADAMPILASESSEREPTLLGGKD